ncbi:MAG: response regulator [Geothrix sp.]|uniref:response regulator n=1 Tax=Geothrix sp. TaxID=1962974 RepID=UPI0017F05052|nr:response regulator [Geothrix sp.]NWJ41082.1 response regulator [Geothrix sp.]WIL20926.1 MAG: response regulator [Geothrix sp.]
MRTKGDVLDLLVPPKAREDQRRRLRHRGIAKSLLSISGVVAILFLAYILVRSDLTRQEGLLFATAILSPILGALFVRVTGRLELGLFLTNMAGIGIVAFWCAITGGITSVALPWFLPNLFLLSTFGSKRMLISTAGVLLAVLVLLFEATLRGRLPVNQAPASLTPEFTFLSILSSVAVVVVAAVAVTSEREKSKRLLYEAKNAAEAANHAKSVFLASMSHELRTPLNAVLLSADLLKEDQNPPLSPRQSHLVDQLHQGGELLLGLVNQVLQLSSIEAGKVTISIEEIPLSEPFSNSLSLVLPLANLRQIQIHFDLEQLSNLRVLADPVQLRSVLINILSNAVKYNAPLGQVFINARRVQPGMVRIEIRDTGQGIPEHLQEGMFQPFNRLGAEGTKIEGTGLGLSISARLIRMMSGNLGFDSLQGQGSTFWVELVDARTASQDGPPAPAVAARAPEDPPPINPPKVAPLAILIVEDHPINQQLLCQTLEKWGHQVLVVSNGAEALEVLGDLQVRPPDFDVILMDLLMPVMDGLEATRRIRQMEVGSGRHIPIVAVTACVMDEDRNACIQAGMDDYLPKPVKIRELMKRLERIPPSGRVGRAEAP